MVEGLESSIINKIKFVFFGIPVCIEADSLRFIETVRLMYQRLEVSEFDNVLEQPLDVVLVTAPESPARSPVLIVDGKVWPHQDEKSLEDLAYEVILSQALARVKTHFLIHAAVVSLNGNGVVIAAESGHGKTTLAIKLLLNGFQYLSDEIAAFGRSDRLIQPFPRALRIKPGTLDLLGLEYLKDSAALWGDKLLLDVESIRAGSLGAPASISHIIIVRDSQPVNDEEYKRELGVLVNQLDENLLPEFREIEGVETVWQEQVLGYPLIRFRAEQRMKVLSAVEMICSEHDVLILDVYKRALTQPSFDQPVRVESLPNSQAVLGLLRQFQPGHKSRLLQEEHSGSLTKMYLELAHLVSQSTCYQITAGPIDEMVEKISRLVSNE